MTRGLWSVAAILLAASAAWGQELTPLGTFTDVRSPDGGDHCSGYSLTLWEAGAQVLGLLDIHRGLCGDPPCGVLQNVLLDRTTGRLRFSASIEGPWEFEGRLDADRVAGTLGGEQVQLIREREATGADFPPNRSLPAWCAFWRGVGRCGGVGDLCASRGIRP